MSEGDFYEHLSVNRRARKANRADERHSRIDRALRQREWIIMDDYRKEQSENAGGNSETGNMVAVPPLPPNESRQRELL